MLMMTIAGTIGRDAELRTTQNGDSVASFSVAVDMGKDRNGNKRDAVWVKCSLWGKRASAVSQYLTKGLKITLFGRPFASEYQGKASLELSVDDFTFQGGGQQSGGRSGGYDQSPPKQQQYSSDAIVDDDIPF
jgi:single-strand DNA-binding protein